MANLPSTLADAIKTRLLANEASMARDNAALDALCQAIAEAVTEHLAGVVVTFPPASIQVEGTAAAQSNPAPVTGGTLG